MKTNTTLIVFLVIGIVLVIALLLYFFLRKENYAGEIRENGTGTNASASKRWIS